jgi:hypothetical protein
MTKIKFVSSFLSEEETYDYILRIYGNSPYNSIVPVKNSDFNLLVVLNHFHKSFIKKRTIAFILEPSWSNHIKLKYLDNKCDRVIFHDRELLKLSKANIIELPSIMGFHSSMSLEYFQNRTFSKNRKMSYVVSSISGNHNYDFRIDLLNKILDSDLDIDIYGKGHHSIEDRRFKGYLSDKKDGLEAYEFSICIENSSEKNYITEKYYDAILCNTVPIYHGAPNIADVFPEKSFIPLDCNNTLNQLKKIILTDDFKNYRPSIEAARNKYIYELNIYKIIENQLSNLPELNSLEKLKSYFIKFFRF